MFLFEQIKEMRRVNPVKFGYLIGGGVALLILLLIIGLRFLEKDSSKGWIDGPVTTVAVLSTLVVLVFNSINNFFLKESFEEVRGDVGGHHRIYKNLAEPIAELRKKIGHKTQGKTTDLTLVTSSIAYGLKSEDIKNADTFFCIIEAFLDDAEDLRSSLNITPTLHIYMWELDVHKKFFGFESNEDKPDNDAKRILVERLFPIICRIEKLKMKNKLSVTVSTTKRLDWRLFMYKKQSEEYGMTTIFTPLTFGDVWKDDWSLAAYSSASKGISSHCHELLSTLNEDGSVEITQDFLKPKEFVEEWFQIKIPTVT